MSIRKQPPSHINYDFMSGQPVPRRCIVAVVWSRPFRTFRDVTVSVITLTIVIYNDDQAVNMALVLWFFELTRLMGYSVARNTTKMVLWHPGGAFTFAPGNRLNYDDKI
jgi:hypothetical protein